MAQRTADYAAVEDQLEVQAQRIVAGAAEVLVV
jgi:hypothetical protein